jgi:Zn-dependent alcohol dehydrogenase
VYDTSAEASRLFASDCGKFIDCHSADAPLRRHSRPVGRRRASGRTTRFAHNRLAGEFDAGALVTRRISLDEVNDAFAAMERLEGIRTVITFPS